MRFEPADETDDVRRAMDEEPAASEGEAGQEDPFEGESGEWLHPISLLFSVAGSVRSFLIPGLLMIVLARSGGYEVWLMAAFVPAVIYAVAHYFTLRYRLADDELVIRRGVFVKRTRSIPYARIQNIDLTTNPFHRIFRVANVKIETASGGTEAEASLSVLSLEAVATMRRRVFSGTRSSAADALVSRETGEAWAGVDAPGDTAFGRDASDVGGVSADVTEATAGTAAHDPSRTSSRRDPASMRGKRVHSMTLDDVVAYGMMSNRGFAIVAALLGVLWQFDIRDRIQVSLPDFSTPRTAVLAIVILVMLGLFGVWFLSVVWAVLRLYGFELTREGEDLRTTCGLFTRHAMTTPRHRVQFLAVRERFLHRQFGRLAIRTETAGGDLSTDSGVHRNWIVPLARREDLPELLAEIQPGTSFEDVEWRSIDSRALRRLFRKGLVFALVVSGGLYFLIGPWALIALASLSVLAWITARIRVRVLGFSVRDRTVMLRDGWWTRSREAVRIAKIQTLSLSQSPFDRRYRMAALTLDTAGAWGTTQRIRIPFLPVRVAVRLMRDLRQAAAATEFRW